MEDGAIYSLPKQNRKILPKKTVAVIAAKREDLARSCGRSNEGLWLLELPNRNPHGCRLGPSVQQSERYDLVCGSMVRPEEFAVEGERTAGKWNARQVLYLRRFLPWIESPDAPIFVRLLRTAQEVDQSIDDDMSADLSADINRAQNVSARIE